MKVSVTRWLRLSGLFLLFNAGLTAQAQTGVTIGASTAPDVSAALDIISTSKGALLPRVADATAILTPAKGLLVFQTGGTPGFYYNAGTSGSPSWQQIATAAGAAVTADNGLTKTGQNIALGGTLTGPTTIAQGGNNFSLTGGNVGIGTANPSQRLTVAGNALITGLAGTGTRLLQTDGTGLLSAAAPFGTAGTLSQTGTAVTGLTNPLVAVSGSLAVVLNRVSAANNTLSLYDISNPAAPVLRGTSAAIANAVEVAISGTTAAVLTNTTNANSTIGNVQLYTLGAGAPALAGAALVPANALSGTNGGIALDGNRLYAMYDQGAGRGYFYVYDVTSPASPALLGSGTGGCFTPQAVAASGNFVAVGSMYGGVSIINVTTPASPTVAGNTGCPAYNGGFDRPVALAGSLLATLDIPGNQLLTYDLSAAGVPTPRNTFATAATPVSVALSGNLAYVACRTGGANVLQLIDVGAATPVLRGTIALDASTNNVALGPNSLAVVANGSAANNLQLFNTSTTRALTLGADGTVGNTVLPSATDYVQNQATAVQAGNFRLNGSGGLGGSLAVGSTVAPLSRLSISPSTNEAKITLFDGGSAVQHYGFGVTSNGQLNYHVFSNGKHVFYARGKNGDGTELMRIQSDGTVGIGTVPTALLDVNGSTRLRGLTTAGVVTTDVSGNLGSATAASLDPTTASNGLTKTGSDFALGGTLAGATTIATGGNNLNLTGTGRLGIGTNNPGRSLDIGSLLYPQSAMLRLGAGNGGVARQWELGVQVNPVDLNDASGENYDFAVRDVTGGATRLLVEYGTGNVGLGTSAPAQKLDVTGGSIKISTAGQGLIFPDATTQTTAATASSFIQNQTAAAQTGGFNLSGAGTVGGLLTAGSATVAGATSTASLAVTGLTAGSVPFVGSAGAVSQDNAKLFFDNTNKRLGIGTATPSSTLQTNGSVAVGVVNGLPGAPSGTLFGNVGYVGLSPNNIGIPTLNTDYYLLPAASTCPGRIYYLRNNSSSNTAYIGTGTGTDGGSIFEGGSQMAAVLPYFMLNAGATKTVTVISDGVNWTLIKGGN